MWPDLPQRNFGRFISCQNTIDSIHATLTRTETDTSGVGAGTLNMKLSVHDAELEVRRVCLSVARLGECSKRNREATFAP